MIPTLQTFSRALLTPDLSFATLADARVAAGPDGLPRLKRTTRFVEAEIEWQGGSWLLSMPLSASALFHIERTASALGRLNTTTLTEYRILRGELRWRDEAGDEHRTDLVLQRLPDGKEFAQALRTEEPQTLLAALDRLEEEFRTLAFTHNNLKAENLRWCGDRFIPLRYDDARIGTASAGDAEAFAALRAAVAGAEGQQQSVSDVTATYTAQRCYTGHRWVSHVFEGLVCVEDEVGFGYVDTDNRPVIAAQFLWAGDFREGRAEVETPAGMGLIDREGHYVIPPEFEIVDYDPAASVVRVRREGRWALYDYLGRRLTEFGTIND